MELEWWVWALIGLVIVLLLLLAAVMVQRRRRRGGVVVTGGTTGHEGDSARGSARDPGEPS